MNHQLVTLLVDIEMLRHLEGKHSSGTDFVSKP